MLPVCILSCLIASCASLPADVVEKPTPVKVPAQYLAPCVPLPSDGTVGQELSRLSDLAQCRGDKLAAVKKWSDALQ